MHLKISSAKWWSFWPDEDELLDLANKHRSNTLVSEYTVRPVSSPHILPMCSALHTSFSYTDGMGEKALQTLHIGFIYLFIH